MLEVLLKHCWEPHKSTQGAWNRMRLSAEQWLRTTSLEPVTVNDFSLYQIFLIYNNF